MIGLHKLPDARRGLKWDQISGTTTYHRYDLYISFSGLSRKTTWYLTTLYNLPLNMPLDIVPTMRLSPLRLPSWVLNFSARVVWLRPHRYG